MKKKALLILTLITALGCTDLQEEILDENLTPSTSGKAAADALIAPVYGNMFDVFTHTNYFALQEISTDEAILPYRGGTDWGDNGIYITMHQHTHGTSDPNITATWNFISRGLSRAYIAKTNLPKYDDASVKFYLAEARAMSAFYNMMLLDLWNIVAVKDDDLALSKILRNEEALNYVIAEFTAAEADLQSITVVGPGRISKEAVWGLLSRLYLNAAVYRDRYAAGFNFPASDMDKVIEYTTKVIASGSFNLSPDYFAIFGNANHDNKELIFALDQRFDLPGSHNRMAYFSISGDQFPLPNWVNANGTDGPAITSDFYRAWYNAYNADPATVDPRFYRQNLAIYSDPSATCVDGASFNINRGILRGQQYGLIRENGAFKKCPDGKFLVGQLFNVTRNKPTSPVNFTEAVDYTPANSNHWNGFRVEKYEFGRNSDSGRNKGDADIIIVRLADMYMMRAEAKLRKGDAGGALADVNFVRASRTFTTPAPSLGSIDLDILFRERGFEFYWEMQRRTDMIRFGKYEGTWTEKTSTDKNKRVFPIPVTAVDAASREAGYLVQNPGY